MNAGEWIKEKRKHAGFGMRQFAMLIGELPSNWCNVENGRREFPKSDHKLRDIARILGIRENSDEWDVLFGFVSRSIRVPIDISHAIEIEHVPTLLRTIGDKKLSGEEVRKIIKYVQRQFGKTR